MLLGKRYRLIHELGEGAFGKTFVAVDTHSPTNRQCVVKQLKPVGKLKMDHLLHKRFKEEAVVLEKLGEGTTAIPKLYAYFVEYDFCYLVQELIEGKSLSEFQRDKGRFDEREVLTFLEHMLQVIDYIHSRNVIHRDIKPDNIIIRKHNHQPVLIDFGIVKQVFNLDANGNPTSSMVAGTPLFMPSEQAAGKPTWSSDLYSLGVTAVSMLTNRTGEDLRAVFDLRTGEISERHFNTGVSTRLLDILKKATAPGTGNRYQNARDMLADVWTRTKPLSPHFSGFSDQSTVIDSNDKIPDSRLQNDLGMELVLIDPGVFSMGVQENDGRELDAKPKRNVTISKLFYIGKTQVTQAQWKIVMKNNPSYFKEDGLPVEQISWIDIQEFLKRLNARNDPYKYRLPTEAEWEYACRAGSPGKYGFGDTVEFLGQYAWYEFNSDQHTHTVGLKQANKFGIHDMHGNVWEWCADWYHAKFYAQGIDLDPQGPTTGQYRVLRGGAWNESPLRCTSTFRSQAAPEFRNHTNGFRIVCTPR